MAVNAIKGRPLGIRPFLLVCRSVDIFLSIAAIYVDETNSAQNSQRKRENDYVDRALSQFFAVRLPVGYR